MFLLRIFKISVKIHFTTFQYRVDFYISASHFEKPFLESGVDMREINFCINDDPESEKFLTNWPIIALKIASTCNLKANYEVTSTV